MGEILITELPKEGHIRVYKITSVEGLDSDNSLSVSSDVLGTLRVFKDQYIWVRDIFAAKKIGRKSAINYFKNYGEDRTTTE